VSNRAVQERLQRTVPRERNSEYTNRERNNRCVYTIRVFSFPAYIQLLVEGL